MSDQSPAGWYPDGHGNERYWDGMAWTENVRQPGAPQPATSPASKKEGTFSKLKQASADRKAAKLAAQEELERQWAEAATAAGLLITSGVFGRSTIELYDRGFVRVATAGEQAERPGSITPDTPYEKLLSIKFTGPAGRRDTNSADASSLTRGATQFMKSAGIMKGNASGLLKGSVSGLVATGLTQVVTAQAGKSFLTITTDQKIHALTNQVHNGFMNASNRGHNDVGVALEAAAASLLGVADVAAQPSAELSHAPADPVSTGPTLSERVRELASLHQDGILSDEEFASAKAKLIDGL